MTDWKNHTDLQHALQLYLSNNGLYIADDLTFQSGIDCVGVFVGDKPVLIIGLPPISNYYITKTEHTDRYLRKSESISA